MLGSSDHIPCVNWYVLVIFLSIKQSLGHAWFLEPNTLGKLISFIYFPKYQTEPWSCLIPRTIMVNWYFKIIYINGKQNLSYAWLFGSHALGKFVLPKIYLNVKLHCNYIWFLIPSALGKLKLHDIFLSIKQKLGHA